MTEIKVTEKDLTGDIAGFPIEVVRKMVEEQVRQGNKADVSIFQECANRDKKHGGFEWEETEDGFEFWDMVVLYKEFDEFFEKYPKQETPRDAGRRKYHHRAAQRYRLGTTALRDSKIRDEWNTCFGCHQSSFEVSNMAIYYADALIAELKKGGEQ